MGNNKASKEQAARQTANKSAAPEADLGTRAERRANRLGTEAEVKHILIKSLGRASDPHQTYRPWTSAQPLPEGYAVLLDVAYNLKGFKKPSTAEEARGLAGHLNNDVVRERNARFGRQPHEGLRSTDFSLAMMKALRLPPVFVQPKATSTQITIAKPVAPQQNA